MEKSYGVMCYLSNVDEYYQSSSRNNKARIMNQIPDIVSLLANFHPNSLDFIRQLQRWTGGIDWWRWLVKCQLARNIDQYSLPIDSWPVIPWRFSLGIFCWLTGKRKARKKGKLEKEKWKIVKRKNLFGVYQKWTFLLGKCRGKSGKWLPSPEKYSSYTTFSEIHALPVCYGSADPI